MVSKGLESILYLVRLDGDPTAMVLADPIVDRRPKMSVIALPQLAEEILNHVCPLAMIVNLVTVRVNHGSDLRDFLGLPMRPPCLKPTRFCVSPLS